MNLKQDINDSLLSAVHLGRALSMIREAQFGKRLTLPSAAQRFETHAANCETCRSTPQNLCVTGDLLLGECGRAAQGGAR